MRVCIRDAAMCTEDGVGRGDDANLFRLLFHQLLHLGRTHLRVVGDTSVDRTGHNAVSHDEGERDEKRCREDRPGDSCPARCLYHFSEGMCV